MPTLTDQLAATKTAAGHLPREVGVTFAAQQTTLAGSPAPIVVPGTEVPDAALLRATGAPTTLAEVLGGSSAVLVFYRGGWCPYCNVALRSDADRRVRWADVHPDYTTRTEAAAIVDAVTSL